MLVVGMGRIGSHLAMLGKAFGMKVIGIRQDPGKGTNGADFIHAMGELVKLVPQADIVALTCCAHARDHRPDERRGVRGDEAVGDVRECGARQGRRRSRPDRDDAGQQDRRSGPRRDRRRAAGGRIAALDDAQCLHNAAHGGRDARL